MHAGKQRKTEWLTLRHARANKINIDWDNYTPPRPAMLDNPLSPPGEGQGEGRNIIVFDDYPLEELRDYIDWTPFFKTWELAGSYPKILDDDVVGQHARDLFEDTQKMLQQIIKENWLQAKAVVGLFPANQVNDDIEVYIDESRNEVLTTLHHLRQQNHKPPGRPNQCLADFVAPKDTGLKD